MPSQPLLAGQLANCLKISPLLAQCLVNRGFSEVPSIEAFLNPMLKQLRDPFLLPNMEAAVERLFAAKECKELVVIFGDYDADGVLRPRFCSKSFGRSVGRPNLICRIGRTKATG